MLWPAMKTPANGTTSRRAARPLLAAILLALPGGDTPVLAHPHHHQGGPAPPEVATPAPPGTIKRGSGCNGTEVTTMSVDEALPDCSATHGGWGFDNSCGDDIRAAAINLGYDTKYEHKVLLPTKATCRSGMVMDAGLCWDTATAIRRAQQFEPFNLTWLEEPLHPDNLQGYSRLTARAPMRIAAGEEICDVKEFQTMMDVGGIDVVQVDVTRVGGLARSKRIGWDSAERHRLCVNHSYKTGINIAASLHFVAALPNSHYFEYCVEQGTLRQTLTRQRFPVVDGDIAVPEEPGLDIELDEAVVAKYRVA